MWNFRSAWNVAALNCLDQRYAPILDGYKAFLANNVRRLAIVNRQLDREYRKDFGLKSTKMREEFTTKVYNYFALPPARSYFCNAALEISEDALAASPTDIDAFALAELPKFEAAFEQFYEDYDKYKVAAAVWDEKYGRPYADRYQPASSGAIYTSAVAAGPLDSDGSVSLSAGDGELPAVQQPAPAGPFGGAVSATPAPDASAPGAVSVPVVQPNP